MLGNGQGGIDWAGLPVVAAYLGITRMEPLIAALGVIKTHLPPRPDDDVDHAPNDPLQLNRN